MTRFSADKVIPADVLLLIFLQLDSYDDLVAVNLCSRRFRSIVLDNRLFERVKRPPRMFVVLAPSMCYQHAAVFCWRYRDRHSAQLDGIDVGQIDPTIDEFVECDNGNTVLYYPNGYAQESWGEAPEHSPVLVYPRLAPITYTANNTGEQVVFEAQGFIIIFDADNNESVPEVHRYLHLMNHHHIPFILAKCISGKDTRGTKEAETVGLDVLINPYGYDAIIDHPSINHFDVVINPYIDNGSTQTAVQMMIDTLRDHRRELRKASDPVRLCALQ